MRGRTMSLYNMMQNGLIPIGTLLLGTLGSLTNLPFAYAVGGAMALVCGIWVWGRHPVLRRV